MTLKFKPSKTFYLILVLILVATAIRIPFFLNHFSLLDSDDAICILISKHISEGKMPPVYFYGQTYQGTFVYHINALMFRIFGYFVFIPLLVAFFFYLGFIITQYFFFKELISSSYMSFILCLFYCLPVGYLLALSFDTVYYSVVLFLGGLIMYLSLLINKKGEEAKIPYLGYLLGLAFWIQPMIIHFALCSFILIAHNFRFKWKKYINFIIYFVVGILPVILYDISHNFATLEFVCSKTISQDASWDKLKTIIGNSAHLFTGGKKLLGHIFIILIFLGIVRIIYQSIRQKRFLPENIFILFLAIFLGVYNFSSCTVDLLFVRYLFPLYFALPFLLISVFFLLKKKIKYLLMISVFIIILIFNMRDIHKEFTIVKSGHLHLKNVINSIEMTGEKYWAGDFWQVIRLTALSGERIIGYSHNHEDYYPYTLLYYNCGDNQNFLISKEGSSFIIKYKALFQHINQNIERDYNAQTDNLKNLFKKLEVKARFEKIQDKTMLIHNIQSQLFPQAINAPIPGNVPQLDLTGIGSSRGQLLLTFQNRALANYPGFRLHVEIPNYSSVIRKFSTEKEQVKIRIPFPKQDSIKIIYYLDYRGIQMPSSIQKINYRLSNVELAEKKNRIVYLSGLGSRVELYGKRLRICKKIVKIEINEPRNKNLKVRLNLYSPFQFSHPYWYGDYYQSVTVEVNERKLLEKRIVEGKNTVEFEIGEYSPEERSKLITLKFKYNLPFRFAPLWKTAALLERVDIE